MPIQTGFWVQVVDGNVRQCWDYKPSEEQMLLEGGWVEAVEVKPDIVDEREIITTHHFDVSVTPVQIVWSKREVTFEERKESLISRQRSRFKQAVWSEINKDNDPYPETNYDPQVVADAQAVCQQQISLIEACATHDDLDNYMAQNP